MRTNENPHELCEDQFSLNAWAEIHAFHVWTCKWQWFKS